MSTEFTGERVVPGQVDINLWNEHFARYAFASRFAHGRRVLDTGSGTGYGTAELARSAASVVGIDIAPEAITYARSNFPSDRIHWTLASCTHIPFPQSAFDLIVSFEVIEHLPDWSNLIEEAHRLLSPSGQFIVSTPNKQFYAESRAQSGPNPFHEHEFEYDEFTGALRSVFPHVCLYVEDHTEGLLFRAVDGGVQAEAQLESHADSPDLANFFIAVCSLSPHPPSASFVYIPRSANLLRERGRDIERLEGELSAKNAWLDEARNEHQQLVDLFRQQNVELEVKNRWATELNAEVQEAHDRVAQLQTELLTLQEGYQARVKDLESQLEERTRWALSSDTEVTRCIEILHERDALIEERTNWALKLDRESEAARKKLALAQSSWWVRLGGMIGIGPELRNP